MKFVENISLKDYEEFVEKHKSKSHFCQSYYFGQVNIEKGFEPFYVGLKKGNKLVATALLLKRKKFKKYCFFYCPRGYVLDYSNLELLKYFTEQIRIFAMKHNAIFVAIDPDIKLQYLDIEGNILNDKPNNFELVKYLKKIGYKHLGYNKNFENREPRYTFRLDLTQSFDEIRNNMHSTTKNILNRGNIFNLECFKGTKDNLKDFMFTMEETAKRQGITQFRYEYYRKFYEEFSKYGKSDLYITKVNINNLREIYNDRLANINQKINDLSNIKNEEKRNNLSKEYNNQLQKALHDIELLKPIKEKELTLTAMITVKYGNKVWTVHGGNCNSLRELNANYYTFNQMIIDAKKEGYEIIDFFGTIGENDKNNPEYGLHLFKKRLGGEYTEFIGEFHLVNKPLLYFVYKKILPIIIQIKKIIKK